MVFHVKNAYANKKIIPKTVTFFILALTLSLFMVQLSPVSAQDDAGASLTGTIYDEGIDLDDDGYYDVLRVGVEINVTTAGTYTVDGGGLYDSDSNVAFVQDNSTQYLEEGIRVLYIDLEGQAIYAGGVSPSYLASVYLYDDSDHRIDTKNDLILPTVYGFDDFQVPVIMSVFEEVNREIILSQSGSILVSNAFKVINLEYLTKTILIGVPENAYNFVIRDEMGSLETSVKDNVMTVTLRNAIDTDETETLYLMFNLPWSDVVTLDNGNDYALSSTFYEEFNSTIETLTVSVVLPEGAKFQTATQTPESIDENGLETVTFSFVNVEPSDDLTFQVNYEYSIFWASFYPTIWVAIIAVIVAVVFFVRGTQTTVSAPTIDVSPKDLKTFVATYDEKLAIKSELSSLEQRLQKGKIPRRKYKVRKKMLEGRLSAANRRLSALKSSICEAGSNYGRLMNQLEVAEATLDNAEQDMQRVTSRVNRGEISKSAYEKLAQEYQTRIDEAESKIDGVLLRLRD